MQLQTFMCSPEGLAGYLDALPIRRAQAEQWRAVPSALADDADHAGPAGSTAHFREWLQGDTIIVVLVNCPGEAASAPRCLDLSAAAARSVSAALPGVPRPGDPEAIKRSGTLCCAPPPNPNALSAHQILVGWRPTLTADWSETNPTIAWTDRFAVITCESNVRAWHSASEARLTVQWWTCVDDSAAAGFARKMKVLAGNSGRWSGQAGVLGENRDTVADLATLGWDGVVGHVRTWAQGPVAVMVSAECGQLGGEACASLTAEVVRDLHQQMPGEVASTDLNRAFVWDGLVVGVAIVGVYNFFGRTLLKIEYLLPFGVTSGDPRWRDVTALARRARGRGRRRYWAKAAGTAGLFALVVGALALANVVPMGRSTAIWALVGAMPLLWVGRLARRLAVPVQDAPWRARYRLPKARVTPRRVLGISIVGSAALVGAGTVVIWLVTAWIHAGGGLGSPRFLTINEWLRPLPTPIVALIDVVLTSAASFPVQVKGALLLGGLTIAVLLTRFGLRLCARSLEEMIGFDKRPALLLLRNFDDDKIRIRRSHLDQPGLLRATVAALSFLKMYRFQELLVRQLSEIGPVIAVSPPSEASLPALGAAQAAYSNDTWYDAVHDKAEKARAVVFLASPQSVNRGLRAELELVATKLSHQRVMLLVPPRGPTKPWWRRLKYGFQDLQQGREVVEGWRKFVAASSEHDLFKPISSAPDGVHIMAHVPGEGWHGWCARQRSDWTYATAIHEVAEFVTERWPMEPDLPSGAYSASIHP